MPRLGRQLLRHARSIDPLLPVLLRPCRDLASARNELRWLREHVEDDSYGQMSKGPDDLLKKKGRRRRRGNQLLRQLCYRRSRGEPLQYILGTQPFGELEILCRPKVLIPRPDTESYTTYLARRIVADLRDSNSNGDNGNNISISMNAMEKKRTPFFPSQTNNSGNSGGGFPSQLRILDLCTGTGCIALLLHRLLSEEIGKAKDSEGPSLRIQGVDISRHALSLARANLAHNVAGGALSRAALTEVEFVRGDVLRGLLLGGKDEDNIVVGGGGVWPGRWDVVVANPPYISRKSFQRRTERSVRLFEPRLALVPDVDEKAAATAADAAAATNTPGNPHGGDDLEREDLMGDVFYERILAMGERAGARLAVMEVEDEAQARRVLHGSEASNGRRQSYWHPHALWRDNVGALGSLHTEITQTQTGTVDVGTGNARAVVFTKNASE